MVAQTNFQTFLTNVTAAFSDSNNISKKWQLCPLRALLNFASLYVAIKTLDLLITTVNRKKSKRFALVIGNEDYSSYQMGLKSEQNVDYAVNDARIFKEYALKSMGVIEENLIFIQNATSGVMSKEIKRIIALTKLMGPNAELIIYYAGHGFPDENSHVPHLIPVDVSGSDLSRAINLQDLYLDLVDKF